MITTTTPDIQGRVIEQYLGVVSSEVIIGANVIKDIFAGLRDFSAAAALPTNGCWTKPAARHWPN